MKVRNNINRGALTAAAVLMASINVNASLIHHWKFDESSGLTAADSAGRLPVTLENGARLVKDKARGQVLELDGKDDYAFNPGSPFCDIIDCTVSVWVKHNATHPRSGMWLSWGSRPEGRFFLGPYNGKGGKVVVGLAHKFEEFSSAEAVPAQDKWEHWAFVRKGDALRLFKNGELVQELTSNTDGVLGTESGLQIGRSYDAKSHLDGQIDDLMIFDEALTQEQIRKLMSSETDDLPFARIGTVRTRPSFARQYSNEDIANRHTVAYPVRRLHRDWIYQDLGSLNINNVFTSGDSNATEKKLVNSVLEDLKTIKKSTATTEIEKTFEELSDAGKPGSDPAWQELYFKACGIRRKERLARAFKDQPRTFIYAKHFVFGDAQAMFALTDHLSDAVFRERGRDYRMGAQLCKMHVNEDGSVSTEVLLDCPDGIVRDPSLSHDGKTLAFSMRTADENHGGDFHLYVMDLDKMEPKQITFGEGVADMEPEWLPDGNLVFTSTRCNFSAPCWWSSVCNLYTCDAQGRYIRRLAVDHGHTVFPHMTNDGRITYTRWEYSDRTAGYLHSLFVMNADGTGQIEYYGNNSWFPAAILHTRAVPNSTKMIAVSGAHHIDQRGKLIMIDRKEGTQAGVGVKMLAPEKDYPYREGYGTSGNVTYDTGGEQWQYPYALDEDNYVVCYSPEGGPIRGLKGINSTGTAGSPAFGIYWQHRQGTRELLIYDPTISSGQQIPLAPRPHAFQRVSQVDEHKKTGIFYVQDVYFGPGLEGVKRGAAKKLRVVALNYRAKGTVALGLHPWGGHQTSPCSINNGSYDVKHVLGEVDVADDGSCYFECPSRVPVYFQLLDERGRMIQNMRSWTMVLPGETFGCIGCHEDKNTTAAANKYRIDNIKTPQKIQPFYAAGEKPVQEMTRFQTESQKSAMAYLGSNAPQGMDVPKGFSYTREIQPIWDRHCIQCHAGKKNPAKADVPLTLLGDSRVITNGEIYDRTKWRLMPRPYGCKTTQGNPGRYFSESYIALTDFGYNAKIPEDIGYGGKSAASNDKVYLSYFGGKPENVPRPNAAGYCSDEYNGKGIINWLHVSSSCGMLPPYTYGSTSSPLMDYLEPSHYNVQLTDEEKRKVACWIDLNVPYCGSWMELNFWNKLNHARDSALTPWYVYRDKMRQIYLYFEAKRLRAAEVELDAISKLIEHADTGKSFAISDFAAHNFGGQATQAKFVADYDNLPNTVPIFGMAEGHEARGGSNVDGNPVRNLALNADAYTYWLRNYPQITSNSHFKYLPQSSPNCAIDGKKDSSCWRPGRRTDLWLNVDFGRKIKTEKVVLTLALNKQEAQRTWTSATLEFSDGEKLDIKLRCTAEPQTFTFPARTCRSVKLTNLKQSFPLTDNGISEFEVWGTDI